MTELEVWITLFLLLCAGIGLIRANPVVIYPRTSLFWLAVLAVGVATVVLLITFYGSPLQPPSGVFNPNGG